MQNKTILIVEDEEDIQELVKYNLTQENYQVHCVGSGESGLQEAKKLLPDLLILDLMLPGMNGLEVCRQLKGDSNTKHIPIIMMTAKGEESDIEYIAGLFIIFQVFCYFKAINPREHQVKDYQVELGLFGYFYGLLTGQRCEY